MEEVSKLKDPDETKLVFFTMDFKVLHRCLMYPGLERTIKAAEQAGIRLLNKPTKHFHCKSCELAKSHKIVSRETPIFTQCPFEKVYIDLVEYNIGWGNKR